MEEIDMEASNETVREEPSCAELFVGFLEVASRSFGGALAWARYVIVERRRWMTPEAYTEAWGVAQLVPGPNVINLAVHLGDRFRGLRGALAAFAGIILVPTAGVLLLDAVLSQWVHVPVVHRALIGLGAAGAGLVWATALKMARVLPRSPVVILLTFGAFVCAGPLRLPLPAVVVAFGAPGVLAAWRRRSAR